MNSICCFVYHLYVGPGFILTRPNGDFLFQNFSIQEDDLECRLHIYICVRS
jgi:hypothetical protein